MRTAREIYERFQVPPWLQLHQLRVAAVGKLAADAQRTAIDADLVIRACLLHDIGAIVKFDFQDRSDLPDLCAPGDLPHWIEVQSSIRTRYGMREHDATRAIIREIGLRDVEEIFNMMGIQNTPHILAAGLAEVQIAQYGDMRVGPYGVISVNERIADISKRYAAYWEREGRTAESKSYATYAEQLEYAVFKEALIRPTDITDTSANPIIERLWDYEIA